MRNPLNVAVVGAGKIAQDVHLPMWARRADSTVKAVVDIDSQRAQALAAQFGVPFGGMDVAAVLADPTIEVVDIATPPDSHAALALQAIDAGKHVLIEKPLAPTEAQSVEIADAARGSQVVVMVAENWLFASAPRTAEQLMKTHGLGRPFLVKAWHQSDLYVPAEQKAPEWSYDVARSGGGYLLQAGVHTFTLLTHLVDSVREVQAWLRRTSDGVEDTAAVAAVLQHGALASLTFTGVSAHPGERRLGFELFFDDAYITFDVWTGEVTANRRGEPLTVPTIPLSRGFDEQVAHFVECIRANDTPLTAPHKVLPGLRAVAAAYRSAASGVPQRVDGEERRS